MSRRKPDPTPADDAAPPRIRPELTAAAVALDSITVHPRNYNNHEKLASLRESLTVNGQYRRVIVQRSTGYIVSGNGVWLAAQQLGWDTIAADLLELDDEQARRLLLVDNASASHDWDAEQTVELLGEGPLDGTGFTQTEYEDLLKSIDDASTLPAETAASTTKKMSSIVDTWSIIVDCDGEQQQRDLLEEFEGKGLRCRVYVM